MKILVRAEALREGLPGGPGGAGSRSEILRFGRRPDSVGFAIMSIIISGRFRGPEGSGPIWGVFGGSETGRLEGRPERPPSSTTRSKSTHSSRLCSVSLSSVLFRSVVLRDVVIGKIFFCIQRSDWIVHFFCSVSRGRIRNSSFRDRAEDETV